MNEHITLVTRNIRIIAFLGNEEEYNIEMSSLSSDASVIINQSALENEYDSIPNESKSNGHVTNSVDHMTKLRELDEYIVMQSAEPVTIINS